MRWTTGGTSPNIEDRRGSRMVRGIPMGMGGLGVGGFIVVLILSLIFKQDFFSLLNGGGAAVETESGQVSATPEEEREVQFVSFVLDDAQATWARIFAQQGQQYEDAKLVLFRDATQTACGFGESASGPFYCPGDHKVYIDLGFFEELRSRFGADGDFAQAYVLAHEIGHHIQALTGSAGMRSGARSNEMSVRTELQADCYAGVWANSTSQRDLLENGDVEEGLAAAAAVGDDRIQRSTTGRVNPDAFTHGSSADRVRWFRQGFTTGKVSACDTFAGG